MSNHTQREDPLRIQINQPAKIEVEHTNTGSIWIGLGILLGLGMVASAIRSLG